MIKENISLKPYCTYKTGGEAEYFASPTTNEELVSALKFASEKKMPVTALGSGSNVLISDDGVKGLVLVLSELNDKIEINDEKVYAGAGVILDKLVRTTVENSLGGMECMSGIPGTVGGAVRMNAGAFGTEIKDIAGMVYAVDLKSLAEKKLKNEECEFGYRKADGLESMIVTGTEFMLKKNDFELLKSKRDDIIKNRNIKQPLNFPSCGSVFKRPEGNYAGALIEEAGLKGFSVGNVQISDKHANFIVKTGQATSADIHKLISLIKEKVQEKTGYILEEEVRYIGF